MFDLKAGNAVVSPFAPASRSVSANGTGVDVSSYTGIGLAVLRSAAGTGTSPTMDVKLQESADDATYSDISGATFTQVTSAAVATEGIKVDLDACAKYLRGVATIAGTSPVFICDVTLAAMPKYA